MAQIKLSINFEQQMAMALWKIMKTPDISITGSCVFGGLIIAGRS